MFSNIFFLIIALLLIDISLETTFEPWMHSSKAFFLSLCAYATVLLMIVAQNTWLKRFRQSTLLALTNVELLSFLAFTLFFLNPFPSIFAGSDTLKILGSLALYFGGLAVFYFSWSKKRKKSSGAWLQIQFLIPFTLPFIFYSLFFDLFKWVPASWLPQASETAVALSLLGFSFLFMLLAMMFLPALIQKFWLCQEMMESLLKTRLERLCQKAQFKHGGFKIWNVMPDALTAAIIGIVPRFRYVMFTPKLLQQLSDDSIEAILCHEIGHSYRKHLWLYPLIILGMILFCALFSLLFSKGLNEFFFLNHLLFPSPIWTTLEAFFVFIPYILIIGFYFRLVFGYFSRLFERQADLHAFVLDVPPQNMIGALNELGILTGNTHFVPSWHHYGIRQRMDYLSAAIEDPSLPKRHDRRVRRSMYVYLIFLVLITAVLLAPSLAEYPIFKTLNRTIELTQDKIGDFLNAGTRQKLLWKKNSPHR